MCTALGFVRKNGKIIRYGITRTAKHRALRQLEESGLVKVKRHKNKSPEVTICDL
jgi:DNA-binding MarR family transcriptional regulator